MWSLRSIIVFPIHLTFQLINLCWWGSLVIIFGMLRLVLPFRFGKKFFARAMNRMYFSFGVFSVALIKLFNRIEIVIEIDEPLSKQKWYLITANHSSYLDIILLIDFCAPRIPPPKFFLKKELIWLPFVGLAAWAMDMPFMRRYSKAYVEKYPHLKGKDIETTKKSCERYVDEPTTVINFVEGTRFTAKKQKLRKSPFSHLLRPKAGGIAFTLAVMGELFSNILDITLAYPKSTHPMMDMLAGRMTKIVIDVRTLPVTNDIIGDYFENEHFQNKFQDWLNRLWTKKNERMKMWMS
ncbi:acyltransferase [Glaciecola sp. 1036]|uniref:acyltransferase n=1 Tax=Alteromonadaceae TaxID=72275 RepID=UPI003CFF2843